MKRVQHVLRPLALCLCAALLCMLPSGCGPKTALSPEKPVTITLWHNFGGQMLTTMDELVDEFNSTVGREQGISLNVTTVSSSARLKEMLIMAANGDPGAAQLPDITTCYPNTALTLMQKGLLVNLDEQFTEEELSAYLPQFLAEGRLEDGGLYVFPFAKSTEVLFLNQTLFDRFSAETGASMEQLATLEGLADAAIAYYDWTDAKTPDRPGDGKAFYMPDSWFNIAQIGMRQLGEDILRGDALNTGSPAFERVFQPLFRAAAHGGVAVYDGYSSELSKTGDIVCSTGSTAGILFYGDTITYADGTTQEVEYTILPYPVLQGGKQIAVQRGSGMCVTRTTPERALAAAIFLKWFTAPEQNSRFVASTGYLPVTSEAFGDRMQAQIEAADNPNVKKLLQAAITMYQEYDFHIPPTMEGFSALSESYEATLKASLQAAQESLRGNAGPDALAREAEAALAALRSLRLSA